MTPRSPIGDPKAEAALVGYLLNHPDDPAAITQALTPTDFVQLAWRDAYTRLTHEPLDPRTLYERLAAAGYAVEAHDLADAMARAPHPGQAAALARRIADLAVRYHARAFALEVDTAAQDPDTDIAAIVDLARTGAANLTTPILQRAPSPTADEFCDGHDDAYDWVIPGLLERGERLLLTASEGAGKSTMLRQVAVCAATGIHPWTFARTPPATVLLIDCENGARLIRRRLRPLLATAGTRLDPSRLRIECRPDGLDLTGRADQQWLTERIASTRPDLLVIGPAYRLYAGSHARGDIGGEDQARTVTGVLDRLRVRWPHALLMETHAPHGASGAQRDLRPFGSSVWLRWPDYGIGLRRDRSSTGQHTWVLEHWRGPRDDRAWPEHFTRAQPWPWKASYPTGTFREDL